MTLPAALGWVGAASSRAAARGFPDFSGSGGPPNVAVIPGIRIAAHRQIDVDTVVGTCLPTQVGFTGRPFIGASGFSGGVSISRNFGDASRSVTVESTPSWHGLFKSYA